MEERKQRSSRTISQDKRLKEIESIDPEKDFGRGNQAKGDFQSNSSTSSSTKKLTNEEIEEDSQKQNKSNVKVKVPPNKKMEVFELGDFKAKVDKSAKISFDPPQKQRKRTRYAEDDEPNILQIIFSSFRIGKNFLMGKLNQLRSWIEINREYNKSRERTINWAKFNFNKPKNGIGRRKPRRRKKEPLPSPLEYQIQEYPRRIPLNELENPLRVPLHQRSTHKSHFV